MEKSMKKRSLLIIITLLITLLYSGCNQNKANFEKIFQESENLIEIPSIVDDNITLPITLSNGVTITWTSSYPSAITNDGKVTFGKNDVEVTLTAQLSYNQETKIKEYKVTVNSFSKHYEKLINQVLTNANLPEVINQNLKLPQDFGNLNVTWYLNGEELPNGELIVTKTSTDQTLDVLGIFTDGVNVIQKHLTFKVEKLEIYDYLNLLKEEVKTTLESLKFNELPSTSYDINITYSYTPDTLINEDGSINYQDEDTSLTIKVSYYHLGTTIYEEEHKVMIPKKTNEMYLDEGINALVLPEETSTNLTLPLEINNVTITWKSNTPSIITNEGIITRKDRDGKGKLTATFSYLGTTKTKQYEIKILRYTDSELIDLAIKLLEMPTIVSTNIELPAYIEYDVYVEWTSSDESIMTNNGEITLRDIDQTVTLTGTFTLGGATKMENYIIKIPARPDITKGKPHQRLMYAKDYETENMNNVEVKEDRLVLKDGMVEGYYESKEIETIDFSGLVASWAATSSTTATVELMVKVKVNNVWSDYITYHPWGFGLNNACYDQKKNLIRLDEDEVSTIGGNGKAVMFKVILRRSTLGDASPKLTLVSFALKNTSYAYPVDITNLPKEVIYDVPRLNQNVVPTIGNIICSATTSTMLLKYKGENFSQYDQYEHRYIAGKVKENNTGIYGNWVYNTVLMSSFGYTSYVARMYSIEELMYHLANVGPVGLSVKGQMTSSEKSYYTNGHLIVGIGYKYIDGTLYILCNDPNVPNVYCEYSYTVIKNTWRNVSYVIE